MVESAKGVSYSEFVAKVMPEGQVLEKQVLLDVATGLSLLWYMFGRARSKSEFPQILGDMCLYIQAGANYYGWVDPFKNEPAAEYCYRDVSDAVHVFLAMVTLDRLIGTPQPDLKLKLQYLTAVLLSYVSSTGLDIQEIIAESMTRNFNAYEIATAAKDFGNG